MFQKAVALLEKMDAALHIATLRDVLVARKQELFVTTDVKRHLQELVEAGSIKENDFMKVVCDFYGTCIEYLEKWQDSYGATANLKWVLLRKMPEWQEIQSSLEELLSFLELTTKEDFEEALFHQWTIVKKSIEKKLEDWNSSGITVSERWVEVFKEMKTENLIEELNVGVALFRDVLLSVSSAQDGPELRQRIRTLRQRCVAACVDASHLLLPHIRSAVSDGIPVDSQQLVNLVCCTQMLLRELVKCRALLVANRMEMRDFAEPAGSGVTVLDKLVLWRPPPKDYHVEELRAIDRDRENVQTVLVEMQEFMPHETNCKTLIEEGLLKWRRKGGLYGQLGHHLCCLCRSQLS
ncbi:uncharacterized protein LOC121832984 [Ixodes scapularis]|uniref:uncharacterized protein LOC121832984 n=1 Tax=Ixodes scapularis TaxID=6945 RepID=UPI001C39509C|nr:uncharacterized protein LOC121832984 [Ixodes scapularis]